MREGARVYPAIQIFPSLSARNERERRGLKPSKIDAKYCIMIMMYKRSVLTLCPAIPLQHVSVLLFYRRARVLEQNIQQLVWILVSTLNLAFQSFREIIVANKASSFPVMGFSTLLNMTNLGFWLVIKCRKMRKSELLASRTLYFRFSPLPLWLPPLCALSIAK